MAGYSTELNAATEMITVIIARDTQTGIIGVNGDLPWYLPRDLAFFKCITNSATVMMGRKTWDSLPLKPLPDRVNVVVTANNPEPCPDRETCQIE